MQTYEGGCHCGAVRFRVTTAQTDALDCNCTICRKKGFLHLIIPAAEFSLLAGEEALVPYRFNTGVAVHEFVSPRAAPS